MRDALAGRPLSHPLGAEVSRQPVLLAATTAWLGSLAAAVSYLASNGWFGAGDLYSLALWSVPLVFFVALASRLSGSWLRRKPALLAYPGAVLLGSILGILTFILTASVLGPWLGAFSFPVLFCWIFGGVVAFLVLVWLGHQHTWPAAVLLTLGVVVILAR